MELQIAKKTLVYSLILSLSCPVVPVHAGGVESVIAVGVGLGVRAH